MSRRKNPAGDARALVQSAPHTAFSSGPEPAPAPPTALASVSSSASSGANDPAPAKSPTPYTPPKPGRKGLVKVTSENTQFLSSVVIGGAGLIATSLYQWNNSKLAQRQAEWQQKREEEKSNNEWRIERAKILAQNLQTLTSRGGDTAEQRYGVLLSLTRGKIIERDLAVSYALELGKDNADDMRSVLANVEDKDIHYYRRLAEAYVPTCTQRYGVGVPAMHVCRQDHLDKFSQGIAGAVADDIDGLPDPSQAVPLRLLQDERYVHSHLLSLLGLYGEFVNDVYERRQWPLLERFVDSSRGARLIGSLDLLMQPIDQVNAAEQATTRQRFDASRAWLKSYITSTECDGECRSRLAGIILSHLDSSSGGFHLLLRGLLDGQRQEVAPILSRLQVRMGHCQYDPAEVPKLRDQVLLPALLFQLEKARPEPELFDDLLSLLLLLPLPEESSTDWKKAQAKLAALTKGRQPKLFFDRYQEEQKRRRLLMQAAAQRQRTPVPPPNTAKGTLANQPASNNSQAPFVGQIKGSDFCPFVNHLEEEPEVEEE